MLSTFALFAGDGFVVDEFDLRQFGDEKVAKVFDGRGEGVAGEGDVGETVERAEVDDKVPVKLRHGHANVVMRHVE